MPRKDYFLNKAKKDDNLSVPSLSPSPISQIRNENSGKADDESECPELPSATESQTRPKATTKKDVKLDADDRSGKLEDEKKKDSDEIDPVKTLSFPAKIHAILSRKSIADIVSWMPHGRSWRVHKPKRFELKVIPMFFVHCKYSSFIRQANGWGFRRITQGTDRNSYYHQYFLRGRLQLCQNMRRPATSMKPPADHDNEPDFYRMSEIDPLPDVSEESLVDMADPLVAPASVVDVGVKSRETTRESNPMLISDMQRIPYTDDVPLFARASAVAAAATLPEQFELHALQQSLANAQREREIISALHAEHQTRMQLQRSLEEIYKSDAQLAASVRASEEMGRMGNFRQFSEPGLISSQVPMGLRSFDPMMPSGYPVTRHVGERIAMNPDHGQLPPQVVIRPSLHPELPAYYNPGTEAFPYPNHRGFGP